MRKQQIILLSGAIFLLLAILLFANRIPPRTNNASLQNDASHTQNVTAINLPEVEKQHLSTQQLAHVNVLEQQADTGDINAKKAALHELAHFWEDSARNTALAAYYSGEKAKLENSEKNLNFAANSLLNNLLAEHDATKQKWLAEKAKDLYELVLHINPSNDSATIGLGSTYMFGNISDNPMEGILKVRAVAERDSANVYAQKMLGLGGMKSGQYANAAKRFEKVIQSEPDNLLVIFSLAECYEATGDKQKAIAWYQQAKDKVTVNEMKKEIDERIKQLKLK